jgi:hypothetical protein
LDHVLGVIDPPGLKKIVMFSFTHERLQLVVVKARAGVDRGA